MVLVQIAPGRWFETDTITAIADDGLSALSVTAGGQTVTIPPALVPRVRAIIGHLPTPPPPDDPVELAKCGAEVWTPYRPDMAGKGTPNVHR